MVIQCHVVPKLQSITPPRCPDELFKLPCIADKAPLADPYLGGSIDLLLGIADVGRCTNGATSSSQDRATIATPTIFGWTLGGAIPKENLPSTILKLQVQDDILNRSLQMLWEMDKVPETATSLKDEESTAVDHFQNTVCILPDGRYQVE